MKYQSHKTKLLFPFMLLLIFATALFAACSQTDPDEQDEDEDTEKISNIQVTVYENDEKITTLTTSKNSLSLYVNITYVFKISLSNAGAIGVTDNGISFGYDGSYISLEDCDSEDEINNSYYFCGLTTTESTTLTVTVSGATADLKLNISLV